MTPSFNISLRAKRGIDEGLKGGSESVSVGFPYDPFL